MQPLVSIIIPCYNTAAYVREAVESALAQTFPPCEVILVDDGSTDGSADQIRDLSDPGKIRYHHQDNQGPAGARNSGWRASRGTHLLFLDSDDYLHPQALEKLVSLLDPEAPRLFAYCDYRKVTEKGDLIPGDYGIARARPTREGSLLGPLLMGGYLQLNGVLLSRALVEDAGGFDVRRGLCEDYDLLLRISCAGAIGRYLDEPLAFYRQRSGSLSSDQQAMLATARAVELSIVASYPAQVAACLPQLVDDFKQLGAQIWQGSLAQLRACEAYARTLEQERRAHTEQLRTCEAYARTLEQERRALNAQVATLQAQAERTLPLRARRLASRLCSRLASLGRPRV